MSQVFVVVSEPAPHPSGVICAWMDAGTFTRTGVLPIVVEPPPVGVNTLRKVDSVCGSIRADGRDFFLLSLRIRRFGGDELPVNIRI